MSTNAKNIQDVAKHINRLIGVDAAFEPLVDRILATVRSSLAAPEGAADAVVVAESRAARERLLAFRRTYLEMQAQLLVRHVGAEYIEGVARAMEDQRDWPLLRFFLAQRDLSSEMTRELQALAQTMTETVLYGNGSGPAAGKPLFERRRPPPDAEPAEAPPPSGPAATCATNRHRFLFQGVGSRGDIAPLLAVAGELARRGHDCHLLANEGFSSEAASLGVRFSPITKQADVFIGADRANPENAFYACLRPVAEYFREHARPDTVVVNADRRFASNLLAERSGLATVRIHLTPASVRSLAAGPYGRMARGLFAQTFRRYKVPSLQSSIDQDRRSLSLVNRRRALVGLAPVDSAAHVETYVRRHVALFPEWFGEPAEDWPAKMEFVGFPALGSGTALPAELAEFLSCEERPLVFTPGTGNRNIAQFFQNAKDCCESLSMPGVLLSGHLQTKPPTRRRRILEIGHADLGAFLGRAAAIVHHGGVGTMVEALRAGVPQVIVPYSEDHADTAERATHLGLAGVVEGADPGGVRLLAALRGVLGDRALSARLRGLRGDLGGQEAVVRCADLLESEARAAAARARTCDLHDESEGARARSTGPAAPAARARAERTVFFLLWPEPGHTMAPAALASALQARGDRAVFLCSEANGPYVRSLGFEHVDLGGVSDWGQRWSIFSDIPGRAALGEAVDRLVETMTTAIERHRPSLIMVDSIYSALALVAEAAGVPWALHETDLPREFDPIVPPGEVMAVPGSGPRADDRIRTAWNNQLWHTFRLRANAERPEARNLLYNWQKRYFPSALVTELERRFGRRVSFDRFIGFMPLARGPRMILCPREFDFERSRSSHGTWVGACIDEERTEPAFPWSLLPDGLPIAYCAVGTQSLRDPQALARLQVVTDVFAARKDFFLVLSCPRQQWPNLPPDARNVLVVERAPQLALLRRASLAVTHAGFNSVKECAALGVPMIALPLSHDQPRNAALVAHHGLGVAFDPFEDVTPARLDEAVTRVRDSEEIRAACRRMKRVFEESRGPAAALAFMDDVMARGTERVRLTG